MRSADPRSIGCLSEPRLVAAATGDAPAPDLWHAGACRDCAGRLAALEGDLGVIVASLRSGGASVPRPRRRRVWMTSAAAAALVLGVLALGSGGRTPARNAHGIVDHQAFLDSLSRTMSTAPGYDHWLQASRAQGLEAGGTCAWGSLSMPCPAAGWGGDDTRLGGQAR